MFFDDDEDQKKQDQFGQDFDIAGGFVAGMLKAFFMIMLALLLAIVLAGFVGYKAAYGADQYTQCSTVWRIECGFSAPGTGWDRTFANGHDPAASCPPSWTRRSSAGLTPPEKTLGGVPVIRYYCDNPALPYPSAGLGG